MNPQRTATFFAFREMLSHRLAAAIVLVTAASILRPPQSRLPR